VLEEANAFWDKKTAGAEEWGPCAEVDDTGREFHYKVLAVTAGGAQFLLFELDTASDRIREVLQKARDKALGNSDADPAAVAAAERDVRRAGSEMRDLLRRLAATAPTPAQRALIEELSGKCDLLVAGIESAVRWSPLSEIAIRLRTPRR
jgi:hypothetical protein